MASNALRCALRIPPGAATPVLPRHATTLLRPAVAAAAFSTSSRVSSAHMLKPDPLRRKHQRRGRTAQTVKIRKKVGQAPARLPEPGQRKAFRKRVQLSNDNALPVDDLGNLAAGSLADPANAGRMLALPRTLVDQLRAVHAFRPGQSWRMFRSPHTLVRDESVVLGKALAEMAEKRELLKMVVTGERKTGKSLLLLQAMAHAFLNKWVVIHIPEAQNVTNATTDYSPVADTSPMRFTQPSYTQNLLQDICRANGPLLHAMPCARDYSQIRFLGHLPSRPTLQDLAGSVRELEFAWPTFLAFWTELTRVPGRPPVLLSLDGLQHIMGPSAYRDPLFNVVHSHDLALVRLFVDALAGGHQNSSPKQQQQQTFVNGGAVLAASGGNDNHRIPSLDLAMAQIEAGTKGEEVPQPDPFEKGYDERVYDAVRDVRVLRVAGVSRDESRSLMEYWGQSGMLMQPVTGQLVSTSWTMGGHGVLGEMEKISLMRVRY